MGKLRESKALLWIGFALYLLLSAATSVAVGYTSAGFTLGRLPIDLYLIDVNVYKIAMFLDKPIMVFFIIFAGFMDNNPGKDNGKELIADLAFVGSGFATGWLFYAISFCVRFRALMLGGVVTVQVDEYFTQGVIIFVCLFILYHSVRKVASLATDKTNLSKPAAKPAPTSKPDNGNGNGGVNKGGAGGGGSSETEKPKP